jgi:PAS domain S-box-containing protein
MLKILLTGQASTEAVVNAVNGANLYRYVPKPWDEADLCLTITEALRSYRQEQQLALQNEALQKINEELEQLNASLEDKVNERTAKLAKAEAEMQGIFAAMTELILVFDLQGRFIKIASNNPTLLPYSSDLLIGKTLYEVYELNQADTFLDYIKQALNTQQTVSVEYSLLINGRQVWCAANISPISADSVIWVIRNMTERKFLEEKLRTSEEKIRAIFEAMTDIVLVIDEQGSIEVAPTNPGRFYKSEIDLISLTIEQFFMEERGKLWFDKVRQALELQQTLNFDYNLPFGDHEIWFSTSISSLPNQSVIWVARDISVRKLVEAAMQEAKEAAIAANLAKSTFLANMSHELRSPLNIILGFSQLMTRSQSLNVEHQENISMITRSGEHLLALINNVLDLSKIEAGRTTLNLTNFNLYQLLDDLEVMFQVKANEKCLKLVFYRSFDVPQYIFTDQLKLRQVLINLINNALKFTQDGAILVRVTVLEPTKLGDVGNSQKDLLSLGFEVEDTGVGIESDELDKIFEAFTQAQTGRNCTEGTGLGLPISRKFVALMGGDISVSSQVGHGSIFKFAINVSTVNATDIENQQPTRRVVALEPNQPRYRILVVDDKWSNRQLLLRLLNPIGFEIQEASNGKEAIEMWESFEPHLIWMDMRMPVMDGYEATRYIKSQLKGQATAILALTASTLEEERAIILSTGCDDFCEKAFSGTSHL